MLTWQETVSKCIRPKRHIHEDHFLMFGMWNVVLLCWYEYVLRCSYPNPSASSSSFFQDRGLILNFSETDEFKCKSFIWSLASPKEGMTAGCMLTSHSFNFALTNVLKQEDGEGMWPRAEGAHSHTTWRPLIVNTGCFCRRKPVVCVI